MHDDTFRSRGTSPSRPFRPVQRRRRLQRRRSLEVIGGKCTRSKSDQGDVLLISYRRRYKEAYPLWLRGDSRRRGRRFRSGSEGLAKRGSEGTHCGPRLRSTTYRAGVFELLRLRTVGRWRRSSSPSCVEWPSRIELMMTMSSAALKRALRREYSTFVCVDPPETQLRTR